MLTKDIIKQQQELSGLTDEQLDLISNLSKNDEEQTIGKRIGELHGEYDRDVMDVTGMQKNQGEKTYNYVKRVLSELKTKAQEASQFTPQIESLKSEIAGYKKSIAEGKGTEEMAKQLHDAQTLLKQSKEAYEVEKEAIKKERDEAIKEARNIRLESEFSRSQLRFKGAYPESVQKTLIEAAKSQILSEYTTDFVEGKVVFRDKDGNIAINKENALNPYTAQELLSMRLKDALDTEERRGAGTQKMPAQGASLDFTQAKTQVLADEIIYDYLSKKGIPRGTREFSEEVAKLRKEAGVEKLPVR